MWNRGHIYRQSRLLLKGLTPSWVQINNFYFKSSFDLNKHLMLSINLMTIPLMMPIDKIIQINFGLDYFIIIEDFLVRKSNVFNRILYKSILNFYFIINLSGPFTWRCSVPPPNQCTAHPPAHPWPSPRRSTGLPWYPRKSTASVNKPVPLVWSVLRHRMI